MDKRIKTIKITECGGVPGVIVNNTYEIWGDGVIYDYRTYKHAEIPEYIYKFRDELLGK